MAFYTSIAEHYNEIFPYNPAQKSFIEQSIGELSGLKILDIGCGTGNLSLALAQEGAHVRGTDLDKEMLAIARQAKKERMDLSFEMGNMLQLTQSYGTSSFDAIICFGNTLAHLGTTEDVKSFIQQAHKALKPEGKLLLQIINYDRILGNNIDHLPTIENKKVRFERNYRYESNSQKIKFETNLFLKKEQSEINNCIELIPILPGELLLILKENEFTEPNIYGSFAGAPFNAQQSIPCIVEVKKISD